ncbi:MAG: ElyC/SanA/YdcF family protein [bacterium]
MHIISRLFRVCAFGVFFSLALCVGMLLSIYTKGHGSIYSSVDAAPNAQVAIVLGASISSNGTLSPVLKERADAAYALYVAKKVSKILVSGDNGTLHYDEVYPVGKYLLAKGIPKEDIFLDYAGFDTYSSMYRARHVFVVSSAIIVSQAFHLPRALFIARAVGLSAVGMDAAKPEDHYLSNVLREVPASLKAVWDVFSNRVPKYMGPEISVAGSAVDTWVGPKSEMSYFKGSP